MIQRNLLFSKNLFSIKPIEKDPFTTEHHPQCAGFPWLSIYLFSLIE